MVLGLVLMASITSTVLNAQKTADNVKKPNVLFIIVDDLRPDLGCYGNKFISTPNIDRLARKGVAFKRAYCNVPVCGASRASLLTGTRPTDYRYLDFRSRADVDYPNAITLPGHFRNNGYYTVSLSKVFHFQNDSKAAWDKIWVPAAKKGTGRNYLTTENLTLDSDQTFGMPYETADVPDSAYFDGEIALKAIKYLEEFGKTGKPFFLAVGFKKPHLPFNAPKKYWDLYDPQKIALASNPLPPEDAPSEAFHPWKELRDYHSVPKTGNLSNELALKLRHAYYASISYMDAQVGLLLDELKNKGLADNTIIVLLGDHGWNLGENSLWGKHCNFNRSMNAPLIFKVPRLTKGGTNASITEFIDIYPTLCNLAGLNLPPQLEGESLVNRLRNPGITQQDYAISKFANGVSLIESNFSYSEWYNKADGIVSNMLYNHSTDPEENINLSLKPEYAGTVKRLSKRLREKRGKDFFKRQGF